MKLQEAINRFEKLNGETSRKSEIKIYKKFAYLISELDKKHLSSDELEGIETELEKLDFQIKSDLRKSYYKKSLKHFEKFIREEFSLSTSDFYRNLGVAFGGSFGVFLGVILSQRFNETGLLGLGIAIGIVIGFLIGMKIDSQAKAKGRVI